jgi:hypothetical protein
MTESTGETQAESGMATGSDAGSPGRRNEFLAGPDDEMAAAAADDAPLPSPAPEPGEGGQDDGLSPLFQEPEADTPQS